jgi:hypothetical protein
MILAGFGSKRTCYYLLARLATVVRLMIIVDWGADDDIEEGVRDASTRTQCPECSEPSFLL